MEQNELEAGADAVAKVTAKYGVGSYISRDQERELAAVVIRAYLAEQKKSNK